jgi:hypothetical protein
MTIMVAGGLTFAVPGVMPEAMAANANLFVSAENSQFDNIVAGPQVVEVVVIDSDINDTSDALGEPDVTVNGKKLRMAQATDGNWYGYFAEVEQAQYADETAVVSGSGGGLDFGNFCSNTSADELLGFSVTETKGVAMPTNTGANGTTTIVTNITTTCYNPSSPQINGTINVVREYKPLNVASSLTGQIGFNSTLYPRTTGDATNEFGSAQLHLASSVWPFIQLYDFSIGGSIEVVYNKGGGSQTVQLAFDEASNIELSLDRTLYPRDADVHITIADNWLNVDPTDEDSWTFDTDSTGGTYYGYYDEDGAVVKLNTADLRTDLTNLLNSDALLKIDQSPNGADIIDLSGNANGATVSTDRITFLESGVNTGIFTSTDSNDASAVEIVASASRGNSATINYDDSPQSILVGHSFATLEMSIDDDEWNSGESLTVTLVDNDLNKNSLSDEDLDVEVVTNTLIPSLSTGDPFTLGEKLTASDTALEVLVLNSTVAYGVSSDVGNLTWSNSGNGTATISVASFSQIGNMTMTEADVTATGESTEPMRALIIDLEATMADLKDSINPATTFYGTNLLAYNLESFSATQTVDVYLINMTGGSILDSDAHLQAIGTSVLIQLSNGTATKALVDLASAETAMNTSSTNADSAQNIGILVEFSSTTTLTENSTHDSLTMDFMSFGFTNAGEDASDRVSNQIVRLELEETGDNTGVFEGTLEFVMINQLNVITAATYTGLAVESDEVTFIAFEDLTDEDSPRVNYLDLGADGVSTQIADQLAAPSHSGTVSFDSDNYKVADTVTITLEDADLNTNSDLIDIFTTVKLESSDADRDQVGNNVASTYESYTFGSLGRVLDVTFDDSRWQYHSSCDGNLNSGVDSGLADTGFTLVETGTDTGVFEGSFQIPSQYCTSSSATPASTTGVDIEVNYLDYRDASGEIIEVGDAAAVRANTGSITLDRTVYPVPFGVDGDFTTNDTSNTPNGRSIFPIHATGIDQTTSIESGEFIANGDLTIHVRVNDPDYDISASGEDTIAVGSAYGSAPVKVSVIRGSETVILGYAGTNSTDDGTIDTNNARLFEVRTFGPMTEIAPDAGIFEADITIRYTDGPDSSSCPATDVFTNIIGSTTTTGVADRFDEAAASGENYCILQGDILQVEYTDPQDASGDANTVTDSATFDLRNGVLQSDKSVYIIGSDIILTLIEPDFDLDSDAAETYDLDLIEWDSDAFTNTIGDEGGKASSFDPVFI